MIYSTENILIQEVHLVLEDGKLVVKMSPAESQHAVLAQQSQPTSGLTLDGKGQLGWGAPNSPSVLPTPSWTDHPSYTVSLPCQAVQSTKTLLWQTLQSGEEFAQQKMSLMLVTCWRRESLASTAVSLGKKGGLRTAMATALQGQQTAADHLGSEGYFPEVIFTDKKTISTDKHGCSSHFMPVGSTENLLMLHTHSCTL